MTLANITRIPWLTLAILIQLIDLVTFLPAVTIWGISGESNPVMVGTYDIAGILGVVALKLVGIAYLLWAVLTLNKMGSRLVALCVALIVTIGIIGTLTNTLAVVIAL